MKIKLFLEGFIIGIGKVIPGVSGALFAMMFGVYEGIVECISHPKKILRKLDFIFPLMLGIVFAIVFGSNIISFLLQNYYSLSLAFFIGMFAFGIIPVFKESIKSLPGKKSMIITIAIVSLFIVLLFIDFKPNALLGESSLHRFISLILAGILDAASTIIPGISGTAILLMLGYYEIVIDGIASLNPGVLIPFIIGLSFGLVSVGRVVEYLFKQHRESMNLAILAFSIFSIIYLSNNLLSILEMHKFVHVCISLILGFIVSYLIEVKIK